MVAPLLVALCGASYALSGSRSEARFRAGSFPQRRGKVATGPIAAIVPAYNEELTVAPVVSALRASGVFSDVLVVNDGSSDQTAARAAAAGATVISTPKNLGKGGAMLYAYEQLGDIDRIAFFDADLLGLRPEHVRRLATASDYGYDMVCAYRDKGFIQDVLQITMMPLITGERILKRWVLDALPTTCWSGYAIETALNYVVGKNGGKTALVQFDGVSMRTKSQKDGIISGVAGHLRMLRQMKRARVTLEKTGGCSCGQ